MDWATAEANRLIAELGFTVETDSPPFLRLVQYLARGGVERLKRREARLTGAYEHKSFDQLFDPVDGVTEPQLLIDTPTMTIGKLIEYYLSDLDRRGVSNKTRIGYRVIFGVLKDLFGEDRPIEKIRRKDCRHVRDILTALPSNTPKKYKGMGLVEMAEKAKAEGIPGRKPGTLKSYLINLTAIFNYAVREEYLEKNPAKGLQDTVPKVSKKGRWKPFEKTQLQAIFNAPLYTGCKDSEYGYAIPGPNHPRRGRFWVPLLALYHGIRLNEACQLLVTDVPTINGITVLVIQEDLEENIPEMEEKKLKTEASTRSIPLHPELVKMGFLKYIEGIEASGESRLFPELTVAKTGYYSDNFSKWFGHFLN
jgi:integrase